LVLSGSASQASQQIAKAVQSATRSQKPFALLVEDKVIAPSRHHLNKTKYKLTREDAIKKIVSSLGNRAAVVATTGKASRELFEYRDSAGKKHSQDLLIVGGMGHASTVALSVATQQPKRKVYCLDGDGAALMHLGSLAKIGSSAPANYYHFVLNNGSHESVGGQPTVAFDIDIPAIAKACGYKHIYSVIGVKELETALRQIKKLSGPVLIEVRVNNNSRSNLSRPTIHPEENKESFMAFLKDTE
jgi:phosphonopyruvate decarboxylase